MVRPDSFQFNEQTAHTNAFQQPEQDAQAAEKAGNEFQEMVSTLRAHNIRVIVLNSRDDVITPDAVFPNNWFTTHRLAQGETLILYPMLAHNRRQERQQEALQQALITHDIKPITLVDLTHYEAQDKFLEGTGSVILDRINHLAYAAISPRTHPEVLEDFARRMNYTPVIFHSYDKTGNLIYHTNVMMSIGTDFVVIAADSITDAEERTRVMQTFTKNKKQIVLISTQQMDRMAGNILEVRSVNGDAKIIMSQTAFHAFTPEQRQQLSQFGELVTVNINTIEKLGGGSARCMLAEIF